MSAFAATIIIMFCMYLCHVPSFKIQMAVCRTSNLGLWYEQKTIKFHLKIRLYLFMRVPCAQDPCSLCVCVWLFSSKVAQTIFSLVVIASHYNSMFVMQMNTREGEREAAARGHWNSNAIIKSFKEISLTQANSCTGRSESKLFREMSVQALNFTAVRC